MKANNEFLGSEFHLEKEISFAMYLDTTNLYGYAMNAPLPSGNFS